MTTPRTFADDADHDHPWAKAYRIPIVDDYASWPYEVALVRAGTRIVAMDRWQAVTPTEDEARVIGSFIDFRRSYYRQHWTAKMLERPFDVDDSTNTVTLLRTETDWAYSRRTWSAGPPYVASPVSTPDVAGLITLLDKIYEHSVSWEPWKAAHPDIFTNTTPSGAPTS